LAFPLSHPCLSFSYLYRANSGYNIFVGQAYN
jgi:hypothetical protein